MRFAVRALGNQGIVSIEVETADEATTRARVRAQSLRPLSVAPLRHDSFPLALFSQELLALLEAGLTLTEAIEALCDKEACSDTRAVLERLLRDLREGPRFSTALEHQPEYFPALYVGLMRAAERTSSLSASLARYLEYRGQLGAVRGRVVSALIYPTILLVVGGAVTAFLLGHVVPRFAGIYQGTGRDLPWLSQQLLAWGGFAAQHGTLLAIAATAISAALIIGARSGWKRGTTQRFVRRLPGVGEHGGWLGEMLCRATRFHDGKFARRIDAFARGFEPLLRAAIGLVVGTIVVLLYLPIFDLAGGLQ